MVDDQYLGAVCGAHGGGGEYLFGRPAADQLPAGDQVNGVAEQRGEADVVDRGQDGDAETGDELQDLDLVADVEVAGRLVQDQVVGALGQGPGDQHPLLLAAGQGVEPALGQVLAADALDGLLGDRPVGVVVPVKGPLVRGSADHDQFRDGEVEFEGEFLRDHGDPPGRVAGPQRQQVVPVHEHLPGGWPVGAVDGLQDGGLPAAVGPQQSGEAPVRDGEADARDDSPARDVNAQVAQFQAHPATPYW